MKTRKKPYGVRTWDVVGDKIEYQQSLAGNKFEFPFVELGYKITSKHFQELNDPGKSEAELSGFYPSTYRHVG